MIVSHVNAHVCQPGLEKQPPVRDAYKHDCPTCKGCPYGDRQYCVGICWKKVYASVLNKCKSNAGAVSR